MFLLHTTTAIIIFSSSFITPLHAVPVPESDDGLLAIATTLDLSDASPAATTDIQQQETWTLAAPTATTYDTEISIAAPTSVPDAAAQLVARDAAPLSACQALASRLIAARQDQSLADLFDFPAGNDTGNGNGTVNDPPAVNITAPVAGNDTGNGTVNGVVGGGEYCWWCWFDW